MKIFLQSQIFLSLKLTYIFLLTSTGTPTLLGGKLQFKHFIELPLQLAFLMRPEHDPLPPIRIIYFEFGDFGFMLVLPGKLKRGILMYEVGVDVLFILGKDGRFHNSKINYKITK